MKKRFVTKKSKKNKRKFKFLLFLFVFITALVINFRTLLYSDIKINNKNFVKLLIDEQNSSIYTNLINSIKRKYEPVKLLSTNYYELSNKIKTKKVNSEKKNNDYLIYLYNTHQKEEYKASNFVESEVKPTVMMSSFIMQEVFNKNNFKTLVEERSISDLLKANNWKYYKSYDASRIYLDDVKKNNSNIKYYIDIHRDSLPRDKTTVEIGGKSYAKLLFLIGVENPNYHENLEFVTKINEKIESKYPSLSKGIMQKGGMGVNGVYNQDNSKYTILVEIGGVDNNTTEVLNSTLAFCDSFMEVISDNES